MKASPQARREATQLFRVCLVNGLLDENRARQAVKQIAAAKPRGYLGTLTYFLARRRQVSPAREIAIHVLVASGVVLVSRMLGIWINAHVR